MKMNRSYLLENNKSKNYLQNFWIKVQQSGIKIKWLHGATTTHERIKKPRVKKLQETRLKREKDQSLSKINKNRE